MSHHSCKSSPSVRYTLTTNYLKAEDMSVARSVYYPFLGRNPQGGLIFPRRPERSATLATLKRAEICRRVKLIRNGWIERDAKAKADSTVVLPEVQSLGGPPPPRVSE